MQVPDRVRANERKERPVGATTVSRAVLRRELKLRLVSAFNLDQRTVTSRRERYIGPLAGPPNPSGLGGSRASKPFETSRLATVALDRYRGALNLGGFESLRVGRGP